MHITLTKYEEAMLGFMVRHRISDDESRKPGAPINRLQMLNLRNTRK